MKCKETEVDRLKDLFDKEFKFETDHYEIPSQRWQTALQKRVSDFCFEYDSPDCLTIVYYAGHGYAGTETNKFKLSAFAILVCLFDRMRIVANAILQEN